MPKQTPNHKSRSDFKRGEIGASSGMDKSGFIISEDYLTKLTGTQRIAVYDRMRLGDAMIGAALRLVKLPIKSAQWRVEPASESRKDKEVADFIDKQLFKSKNKTWEQLLQDILLYLDYGCMPFELVYDFDSEGRIVLDKMAPRFPDTIYAWKLKDGEDGVQQSTISGSFEIPLSKMVIFVNEKEGDNWEGVSILRRIYRNWYMKDKYYRIDAIATERQGLGIPEATYPDGTSEAEKDEIEKVLKNLRANDKAFVMHKEGTTVGIMDMKGSSVKNPEKMIEVHNREMLTNFLVQFLLLGSGSTGSFALSKDHSQLFIDSLESIAKYITATVNEYVIKRLVDFNFDVEEYPELIYDNIGRVDLNAFTTSLQRALQVEAIELEPSDKRYIRDVFDFPESEGLEVDPSLVDDMMADLDAEFAAAFDEEPAEEEPQEPTEEEIKEAAEGQFAYLVPNFQGEVTDETRKKISEALKRYWDSKGRKGKGSGKGKKKKNPEVTKANKEIRSLRKEAAKFNREVRMELLEMKAKGIKLSPEEMAKKQLDILRKKNEISDKIDKLKERVEALKEAAEAEQPEEPQDNQEASEHSRNLLAKISDSISSTLGKINAQLHK